ncbi:hypothetical protein VUR80DRAFT_8916 [Thermomyces stellatus]
MADFSCYGGASDEWRTLEASLPSEPADPSLPGFKEAANAVREATAAEAFKELAPRLLVKDYSVQTRDGAEIEARTYRPLSADEDAALPLYIHYHGGGYFFGTLASEDAICGRIALGADVAVLNVNYRHTPDVRYPVPFDDAEDAFVWAHEHIRELGCDPEKVVLGGISAGAHFAASITLRQHLGEVGASLPKVAGQVLMIPALVSPACYAPQLAKLADPSVSSLVQNENAPILPKKRCEWFLSLLDVKDPEGEGLKLSPGNATPEQVRGMPPSVFGITGMDPLRDEGLLYAAMLTEAGVPTDINVFKGLPHGFRRYNQLSESKRWDRVMEDGIRWALAEPSPSRKFIVKLE